jgi:hypothetical protein
MERRFKIAQNTYKALSAFFVNLLQRLSDLTISLIFLLLCVIESESSTTARTAMDGRSLECPSLGTG